MNARSVVFHITKRNASRAMCFTQRELRIQREKRRPPDTSKHRRRRSKGERAPSLEGFERFGHSDAVIDGRG